MSNYTLAYWGWVEVDLGPVQHRRLEALAGGPSGIDGKVRELIGGWLEEQDPEHTVLRQAADYVINAADPGDDSEPRANSLLAYARLVLTEPELATIQSRFSEGAAPTLGCGPGWWPILQDLDTAIAAADPDARYAQIAADQGLLVVDMAGVITDSAAASISTAQALARQTCEVCGMPGSSRADVPARTLCEVDYYPGTRWA